MTLRSAFLTSALAIALGAGSLGVATAAIANPVETSVTPASQQIAQTPGTIVEVASGADQFETLVQAVQAANLVNALSADGPLTVFAPTDEAFAELPNGVLAELVKPANRQLLTEILTYHVVPGRVMAADLRDGSVTTLQGSGLAVDVTPERVVINNGSVTTADIAASNGVVHEINRVLIPESLKPQIAALVPIRGLW
ncbi:MAG: fasciclin domain-containing protein [Spirulinaceae cyanobacterium SM2_1_0]|nr:fasciclin domain-containing protein [Spirulinaceae cyanobacterium SM2_1_0]